MENRKLSRILVHKECEGRSAKCALFFVMLALSGIVSAQPDEVKSSTSLSQLLQHVVIGEWGDADESDGVTIWYRDIEFSNGDETRQLKAEFTLHASLDTILHYMKQPELVAKWNEGFSSCSMLEDNGNHWVLYSVYDIPFPLTKKDLVADYRLHYEGNNVIVNTYPRPEYKAEVKGYERERYNFNEWTLIRMDKDHYKAVFNVITLSSSSVPNFIKDPIIQRTLIKSFVQLREAVKGK